MKRIMLKITGEIIKGTEGRPFDPRALSFIANEIAAVYQKAELAIILGGGNIVRGRYLTEQFGTTSYVADHMGMLATIMNALLLQDFLEKKNIYTRVLTSLHVDSVAEPYIIRRARRHLEKGRIVLFAAGTGNTGVTTDTAAILKAQDLDADIVMKGTRVKGVYTHDPETMTNPEEGFLPKLTHRKFLELGLTRILDRTAVSKAEELGMPIWVFNIFEPKNLLKAVESTGNQIGTLID